MPAAPAPIMIIRNGCLPGGGSLIMLSEMRYPLLDVMSQSSLNIGLLVEAGCSMSGLLLPRTSGLAALGLLVAVALVVWVGMAVVLISKQI